MLVRLHEPNGRPTRGAATIQLMTRASRMVVTLLACFLAACGGAASPGDEGLGGEGVSNAYRGPHRICINRDDYRAKWVGRTADGTRFMVTRPFEFANPPHTDGCEYVAVFLWERDGSFREMRLDSLGPRATLDRAEAARVFQRRLEELGDVVYCDIVVAPFEVEREGTTFGLVYTNSEYGEWVELLPGNSMAFTPPWDGDYDT